MIKTKSYVKYINDCSLKKGDIVDVSSDLKKIIMLCYKNNELFDADELIECLIDKVGSEGTLLIRSFNWDFCKGIPFDYKKTVSRVGALGNVALKRDDFKRTRHPIYSWCVWGKYQNQLVDLDNKGSFSSDSPFGFLYKNNGKQLFLGSDMYNSLTYVHFVEEQVGVKYRYQKNFTSSYTDENGVTEDRTYSMNVRDLDLDIRMFNHETAPLFKETFEELFKTKGILQCRYYDDCYVGVLNLTDAYKYVEDDILNNRSKKICIYKGQ